MNACSFSPGLEILFRSVFLSLMKHCNKFDPEPLVSAADVEVLTSVFALHSSSL